MTSKDLRMLMSTELDTLAPMPDLVPQVIREGAAQVRRRRLAVGGLVAAAAIGGVAIAPWANGRSQGSDSRPADGGGSSAVPSPSAVPSGGSLDFRDPEVIAAVVAALPSRFSPVLLPHNGGKVLEALITAADEMVKLTVTLTPIPDAAGERTATNRLKSQVRAGNGSLVAILVRQEPWLATILVTPLPDPAEQVAMSQGELTKLAEHPEFLAMLGSRTASDLVQLDAPVPAEPTPADVPEAEDAPAPPTDVPTEEPTPTPQEPVPTPREPSPTPREPVPTLTSEPSDAPPTAPPSDK